MRCAYYTDGQHRQTTEPGPPVCHCGAAIPASIFDTVEAPARRTDPYPSRQAAQRTRRRAQSQTEKALHVVAAAGATGASTREIQEALYAPADPAWNKVATRCLELERRGLVKRWAETRPADGQHYLVYEVTAAGDRIARDDT